MLNDIACRALAEQHLAWIARQSGESLVLGARPCAVSTTLAYRYRASTVVAAVGGRPAMASHGAILVNRLTGSAAAADSALPLEAAVRAFEEQDAKSALERCAAWESIAPAFDAARSGIGSDVARAWAKGLAPGGDVLDLGCGAGWPIASTLAGAGHAVFGIDASPTLVSLFRRRIAGAQVACERVQDSALFGRTFDGVIAVGLMFLLSPADQELLIGKVGNALKPGGRFLFSAPRQPCVWHDAQTGQVSQSLGQAEYGRLLAAARLRPVRTYVDDGDNHYIDAVRNLVPHRYAGKANRKP